MYQSGDWLAARPDMRRLAVVAWWQWRLRWIEGEWRAG